MSLPRTGKKHVHIPPGNKDFKGDSILLSFFSRNHIGSIIEKVENRK